MKKAAFLLLCLIATIGLYAQDKKIAFKSATASSYQSGEEVSKAIDGKPGTIWHSSWGATSFPVTLTVTLSEEAHIDYLRYTPRQDGNVNGNWENVTVEYCATTGGSSDQTEPKNGLTAATAAASSASAGQAPSTPAASSEPNRPIFFISPLLSHKCLA